MTTTSASDLGVALESSLGRVHVRAVGDEALVVEMPSARMEHDWTTVIVEWTSSEWVLSDGGITSLLLDSDFERTAEVGACAGAPFVVEGHQLVHRAPKDRALAPLVLTFQHHLAAMPGIRQAVACATASGPASTSPALLMAQTSRELIAGRTSRVRAQLVHVGGYVERSSERVRVPLSISATTRRPALVASYVDLLGTGQGAAAAKRTTSFLLDVVADLAIPKYVVANGRPEQLYDLEHFYEPRQVNVVPFDSQDRLIDDALEVLEQLLPA